MAGTRAEGVAVPDDFDITITSTSEDESTVRAAVGLEAAEGAEAEDDADAGEADAGDEDDQVDGEDDADAADGDEDADDGEPEPTRRARSSSQEDYEDPIKDETPEQATARIERNVKRIQRLNTKVANKDQRITVLEEQLRQAREGRRTTEEEPPAPRREATPPPKFAFPTFEEWSEVSANEGRTLEEYSDERSDARTAFKNGLESATRSVQQRDAAIKAVTDANAARVTDFRRVHDDYDDVLATSKAPMTPTMQITMMQRDYGPAIAYYASSTTEGLKAAQRIAKLPPLEQIEELGVLARSAPVKALMLPANGRRSAPATTRRRAVETVADEEVVDDILPRDEDEDDDPQPARRARTQSSRAPRPLRTVAGGAKATRELAELSTDEFIARADEEDRKRGRRR